MPKTEKQLTGKWGEDVACRFLEERGYNVVDRNFQVRMGEIDIIAWHEKKHFGRTLCFIEVKTRGYGLGSAERATGREKLQRIFAAAKYYCKSNHLSIDATPIQFEQVSVYGTPGKGSHLDHYVIPVI